MKPTNAWVVVGPQGKRLLNTVRELKEAAMQAPQMKWAHSDCVVTWPELEKFGYRCIPVTITERET
jgi:hypothetical protein